MSVLEPVTVDSEICQVLNCLPEKFVVDFANGIDVARDHLRAQKARGGFYARCYDGFTGQGARRQAEINACVVDGVEASLEWLTELSESLANSNLAISRVNDRVSHLTLNAARIADYSASTRRTLEALATRLDRRCRALEEEVGRIDFVQRVQLNLDQVFNKWRAGRYGSFSLGGRCYVALEELRWGAFGDYCRTQSDRQRQTFLEDMVNRAMAQMAEDAQNPAAARLDTRHWLTMPAGRDVLADAVDALAYLGDGSDGEEHPFIFAVTQASPELPRYLPRISSAKRVTEALAAEVFGSAYV